MLNIGKIDLLVGGTPCQSFSINGLRQGLTDERGSLTLAYVRLLSLLSPRWFLWENVPGFLTSGRGRDFARFLLAVGQCGYGWAYRILDAQYFGIPQRRRRLFVVGRSGAQWGKAAAALFDTSREGQNAGPVAPLRQGDSPSNQQGLWGDIYGWTGDPTPKFARGLSPTLRSQQGGEGAGFAAAGVVARFTAREWERLQGFPDDYTAIPRKGGLAGDRLRIKAVGNAFPVPILNWIGKRIQLVDQLF